MVFLRLRDHWAQIGDDWRSGVGWGEFSCAAPMAEKIARAIRGVWPNAEIVPIGER